MHRMFLKMDLFSLCHMFLLIKIQPKTLRSSNQLLHSMPVPYICLYSNIYCARWLRITNIANKPNMKMDINMPWKLMSLSLSVLKWQDGHWKMSREQRRFAEKFKWSFTSSSALVGKGFFFFPTRSPSALSPLGIPPGGTLLSELAHPFSNDVADTLGCILGTWWKDVVPRGFESVLLVFFQARKLSCAHQRARGLCEKGVRKEE